MKSTFRILFYGRTNEQRKDGTMPLTARVTINGETVAFNIKMSVPVAIWDGKSSRAKGRSLEAIRINRYLESINSRLVSLYQNLTDTTAYLKTHFPEEFTRAAMYVAASDDN